MPGCFSESYASVSYGLLEGSEHPAAVFASLGKSSCGCSKLQTLLREAPPFTTNYYDYYYYYYYCHYYADFGTNCMVMVENDAPTEDITLAYDGNLYF